MADSGSEGQIINGEATAARCHSASAEAQLFVRQLVGSCKHHHATRNEKAHLVVCCVHGETLQMKSSYRFRERRQSCRYYVDASIIDM